MTRPPSESIAARLRCPACRGPLRAQADESGFACMAPECGRDYPALRGIPVLVDEGKSLLSLADYRRQDERILAAHPDGPRPSWLRRWAGAIYERLPDVDLTLASRENYALFAARLLERSSNPCVLVVGGREAGRGMQDVPEHPRIELVETDIDFGPRTRFICDAHQLPFAAASFDGVVIQAVLEHVLDPYECVEEIHRVLGPEGLVYAETPFLYRRHGGPFDFTRFTFLGHRRFFRRFEEIAAGVGVGPGVALALAYSGFLLTLSKARPVRAALRVFARITSFWLKYFDRRISKNDAALDSAAGFYFLGRRSETAISDRELIAGFRGLG